MTTRAVFVQWALLTVGTWVVLPGCEESRSQTVDPPKPIQPTNVPAPASTAPRASLEGRWAGTYQAAQFKIELPKPAVADRSWKQDDGTKHVGEGTLSVVITADGSATGAGTGPLGEFTLRGAATGDSVSLRLDPRGPGGSSTFAGVVTLERADADLTGELRASSGDTLLIRHAAVRLQRAKGENAP